MKTTRTPCARFLGQEGRGFRCLRSFMTALFFIIISIKSGRGCIFLSHPPSFHLFNNSSLCVCGVGFWPPKSICTTSVCSSCVISRDVSATVCDVMMTLVSLKTRLKTKGPFDAREVCACRGKTVYCTTELCLWTKVKKTTNKEGTMLVYTVNVMYILSHVTQLGLLTFPTKWSLKSVHDSTTDNSVILLDFQFTSKDAIQVRGCREPQ